MSDVLSEVEREILNSPPPAESLFRFRTVCKSWRHMIDDTSFIRSHTANNHCTSPNLLIRNITTFYSFPLDSLNYDVNGEQTIHAIHVKNLTRPIRFIPVSSCNGLILVLNSDPNQTWAIWNPSTGDFHNLSQPDVSVPYETSVGYGNLFRFEGTETTAGVKRSSKRLKFIATTIDSLP